MVCEEHKKQLMEAASGFRPASSELNQHLGACPGCQAGFGDEQGLFARIDAHLHQRANAAAPMRLIPDVRAAISIEPARMPSPTAVWVPVAAAVALIAGVAAWHARRTSFIAHEAPIIVSSNHAETHSAEGVSDEAPVSSVPRATKHRKVARREFITTIDFQPLVPAEQQAAFDRLIENIRRGQIDGKVLMVNVRENLDIPPMVIRPIAPESSVSENNEAGSSGVPANEKWSDSNRSTK